MFKKTQFRLVTLNVIVFVILLYALGTALYLSMQVRLYSQVDRELQQTVKRMEDGPPPHLRLDRKRFVDVDRRIVFLFWDDRGEILGKAFGESIEKDELLKFRPALDEEMISNVSVGGQLYRVYSVAVSKRLMMDGRIAQVRNMQLIYNLEPEQKMLSTLLYVLGIGGFVSIIIALFASRFLAKRALVPIQLSWDKQQQFIADASHELRTPLSVILLNLERLFRTPGHTIEQESEIISVTMQEAKRVNKLVSDLLTLARSDSNELQIMKKNVRLDQLLQSAIRTFQQLAILKDITIASRIEQPLTYTGDEERLHQLVVILLDNALKYTPEKGEIIVTCKREGNQITLVVRDTGIGIPADEREHVFDRFFRGDKMRPRTSEGTGLGLSIAKWIVDAHGGKIRVDSEEGQGSTFTVSLPAK